MCIRDSLYKAGRKTELPIPVQKGCYRRLTVRECLRLQSFPDWWRFPDGVSISKKYGLVGEAVPPILAYRLAVHIGRLLGWSIREPPKREEWCLPYFKRAFADYLNPTYSYSRGDTYDRAHTQSC